MSRPHTPDLVRSDEIDLAAYRKYASAIERVLVSFETIDSWPDNIAFLNRLLKTVQLYPTLSLPKSLEVSNCLALCLAPGLPSGVQQKALEVYSFIFSSRQALERELPIFLFGLMPVLSFASTTVKESYAALLSTFIIPLGKLLTTYARGLILALLPGIEDEHDDFFATFVDLLDSLRAALGDDTFFWSAFWLATSGTTSTCRLGSLNYLLQRMPKLKVDEIKSDALNHCIGLDPSLIVSAFSIGLTDQDPLVQRGFLELLLTSLPLKFAALKIPTTERQKLLHSAIQIVLRRDVSLNRRLWTWLSNSPEVIASSEEKSLYFHEYVMVDLTKALRKGIENDPTKSSRILLSLLDRRDIGGQLIDTLFPLLMNTTYERASGDLGQDIRVSTTALFEAVPIYTILTNLAHLCSTLQFAQVQFMFEAYNFSDEIVTDSRMSTIFLDLLLTMYDRPAAIEVAAMIMSYFSVHHLSSCPARGSIEDSRLDSLNCELPASNDLSCASADLSGETLGILWPQACFAALIQNIPSTVLFYEVLNTRLSLGSLDDCVVSGAIDFMLTQVSRYGESTMPFEHIEGLVKLLPTLNWTSHNCELRLLCSRLSEQCWDHLGSTMLKYEISAVYMLDTLCSLVPVEISETFFSEKTSEALRLGQPIDKFGALWSHLARKSVHALLKKSTLLILDTLAYDDISAHSYILRWIRSSVDSAPLIVSFLLEELLPTLPQETIGDLSSNIGYYIKSVHKGPDQPTLSYNLKILRMFLDRVGPEYRKRLDRIPMQVEQPSLPNEVTMKVVGPPSYSSVFRAIAVHCLNIEPSSTEEALNFAICDNSFGILRLTALRPPQVQELEITLSHKLLWASDVNYFDVAHLTLDMLSYLNSKIDDYLPLPRELIDTLTAGICKSRGHPILQDYLAYLQLRVNVEDKRESTAIVSLTCCIAEQIDLNLIDIDAVLTTNYVADQLNTAHENVLLYLDALERLGCSMLEASRQKQHQVAPSGHQSFFAPALTVIDREVQNSDRPISQGTSEVEFSLSSIIRASSGVWLWAANNNMSELSSIRYISGIFMGKAQNLMLKIVQLNAAGDVFDLLLNVWADSTRDTQVRVEALCRSLLPDLVTLACRNVKSKLSFSLGNTKQIKELQAHTSILFSSSLLGSASPEDFNSGILEATGLLRHMNIHMPGLPDVRISLLKFVTQLSSNLIQTHAGKQKKTRREIADLVTKIMSAAIIESNEEELRIVLKTQIIPDLPRIYLDLDRVAASISIIMTQCVLPRFKSKTVGSGTLEILEAIVLVDGVKKTWKKDVQDLFAEAAFFDSSVELCRQWMTILAAWLETDLEKISDYINRANSNATGHLFTSAGSEKQAQVHQTRQLIFLLLAMPPDAFLIRLSAIENRMCELFGSGPSLQAEALLCLQSVLLRFSEVHMGTFWIRICIELQKVFVILIAVFQTTEELENLLHCALQTLDLILYQSPSDFQS